MRVAGTLSFTRALGVTMRPFVYEHLPVRVVFGVGSLSSLAGELEALGVERWLVIAGGSAAPVGERAVQILGSRVAGVFGEVRQHVPERLAAAASQTAREVRAEGLLTIGGGSAIGLGKAVALTTGLPVVAVPTTYSGSEMTSVFGIMGDRKRTGRDPRVLPRLVVYDPALTTGLPPRVTASSGFNALAHCVEALYAAGANPVTSLMAEEGLRVLARSLSAAVKEPDDLDARSELLYGAHLAGSALAVAGTALHHKLCHVIGGDFGLVHADVHAVLLPHVAAFNQPAVPDVMQRVARALEGEDAAPALLALADEVGAPTSLADIGMPQDGLDAAAERAVAEGGAGNPRPADVREIRSLLEDAYQGRAPHAANGAMGR
jgi:maleylacetate reductase